MKKQSNLSRPHVRKLSLNKKTISNLTVSEMNRQVGGDKTNGNTCAYTCGKCISQGITCNRKCQHY